MVATLLMDTIASDQVIDEAYAWLCERRKDYAPDADVWHLRFRWVERKPQIQARAFLNSSLWSQTIVLKAISALRSARNYCRSNMKRAPGC